MKKKTVVYSPKDFRELSPNGKANRAAILNYAQSKIKVVKKKGNETNLRSKRGDTDPDRNLISLYALYT